MTARERRVVVGGAMLAVVCWMGLRGGPFIVRWIDDVRSEIRATREVVARQRGILAVQETLTVEFGVARTRFLELGDLLIEGEDETVASRELELRIRQAASIGHAHLISVVPDTVAVSTSAALLAVSFVVQLETDAAGLGEMLMGIASQRIAIEPIRLEVKAVDPASPTDSPERLRVEIAFRGWFLGPNGDPVQRDEL